MKLRHLLMKYLFYLCGIERKEDATQKLTVIRSVINYTIMCMVKIIKSLSELFREC